MTDEQRPKKIPGRRRGLGRKREKLAKLVTVRVTPKLDAEWREWAAKDGLSVSDWIRGTIITAKLVATNPRAMGEVLVNDVDDLELNRERVDPNQGELFSDHPSAAG